MTGRQIARAQRDEFEELLQRWGSVYGGDRYAGMLPQQRHPLARAAETGAHWTRRMASRIAGRDGSDRRRAMARGLESCGVRLVPMAYVDHVPCADDSGRHGSISGDPRDTEDLQDLQAAWLELQRMRPDQAEAVRLAYHFPGITNAQRAQAMKLSVDGFERRLRLGRDMMAMGVRMLRAMRHVAEQWEASR
jgi:hypothetical protein